MARVLNLAVAQMGPIHLADDRQKVVARMLELLRESKARGAELVVFPELALTTFFPRHWADEQADMDRFFETAMPGGEVTELFAAAADARVGFYLGYAELTPEGRHFNTTVLVNRAGEIVGKYRKIHLPGHAEHHPDARHQHLEKRYFEVGNLGWGVFDYHGHAVSMGICNDRRWPETYRMMSLQGAEVALFGYNTPSANPDRDEEPHLPMSNHLLSLQAGAYQNSMWVAAAAKCGAEDGHHMIGGSAIVAPSGEIVARAYTEDDEVISARLDLDLARHFSQYIFNFAAHRQPHEYGLITERTGRGEPLPVRRDLW